MKKIYVVKESGDQGCSRDGIVGVFDNLEEAKEKEKEIYGVIFVGEINKLYPKGMDLLWELELKGKK